MRALTFKPDLSLDVVPDPVPTPSQALIQVAAVSLNFGEIAYRSANVQPRYVPGWDAAGVVVQAAADGSGPAAGTRVVTFGWSGAWAELRAVDTAELEDDGVVMAIGRAAREATTIDLELAGTRAARGRIENFNVTTPFSADLAHLVELLAVGELDVQIGWRGPWNKARDAADALLARRVAGKAVLDL